MKTFKISIYIVLLLSLLSCEKYLSISPPNDKLESSSVFADSLSASLAISGIYSQFVVYSFPSYQVLWAGLSAKELSYTGTSDPTNQIQNGEIQVDNASINSLWSTVYMHIYQANSAIEGLARSTNISPSAKLKMTAELRFFRAFLLFYTVNDWGDIPLTLSTDYRVNQNMERTNQKVIYDQIIADLDFSMENMQESYLSSDRARPNKWAAVALLARVYLYLKNWEMASDLATRVIQSGEYSPLSNIEQVFLKGSKETIWQLYPASLIPGRWTDDGYNFIPASLTNSVLPTYLIPTTLYTTFEVKDQRKSNWIGTKTIGDVPYYFPYKYKVRSGTAGEPPAEYTVMLRLSEQYLIRAEARAWLGNPVSAMEDLNMVRLRAGLEGEPSNLSQAQALAVIETERKHELFCEWGHRWFDLIRAGKINKRWPIPLNQLLTNPNLIQNPDYK